MEFTFLLPIISEILKNEGSFGQKILMGGFLLIVIHFMGRNHIKLITKEMKSIKEEMSKGFSSIKETHNKHEAAITTLQIEVKEIGRDDVIKQHEKRITKLEARNA